MPLPLGLPGAGSQAAAAAAPQRRQPVSSGGGSISSTAHCNSHSRALHAHTVAAAAAAAAFPLPDGNSHQQLVYDARRHHSGSSSSSSSSSRSAEDRSQQAAHSSSTHAAAAAAAASASALVLPPPATHYGSWPMSSSSIRHSVEEAMRGVHTGDGLPVAFVPAHKSKSSSDWQQQQQQQLQHGVSSELDDAAAEAADAAASASHSGSSSSAGAASRSSTSGVSAHALTKLIQGCRSAVALEALLQQHEDQQLDHVHACAAFVQLARLHRQQQRRHDVPLPLLQRLETVVLQQLPRLQSRHTSNVLWACACLGHAPSAPLLQGLLAHAQPLLAHGTTPQGFANTLWAAASLRAAPSEAWMAQFFAASQRHLPNFQPQELSSTIWALAQLQQQPPPAWHAAFMASAAAKLGSASSQALSNTLWGLAKLRLWVAEDVWAALTYACSLRAAEFSAGGLSQLCWAAGMLVGKQQRRSQRQQDLGQAGPWQQQQQQSSVAAAAGSSAFEQTEWLQPLLVAAEQQLPQYSASTLASLLWSLAVMQHVPGQQFVAGCLARLASTAQELSPASTATAVWAVSKLDADSGSMSGQQLAPLLQQLQVQLPRCSPQHCVYVAAALVHLKQQHAGHQEVCSVLLELEQQLLAACQQQLPSFGLGQLCQLAKWLVAANVSQDAAWVHAFLAAVAQQLPALQPVQQLLLLQAVTHWRVAPHQGWSALFLAAVSAPHAVCGYSAAHVGTLLQAFAAAGMQPGAPQLRALLQHVLSAGDGCCPAATAAVLGGLCSLGFRPPSGWTHQLWAASARGLVGADAAGLACLAQALQHPGIRQLALKPNKPLTAAFSSALVAALPQLQPQQAAAALAALAGLHLQPPQQERQQHAQLLSCLMAAAAKGLYSMPLQEVVAAWWGLVELRVLGTPVPLQQLASPASHQQEQQQQDQQWLQQQWQGVWLRRIFSSSGTAAADLSGLGLTPLLQLADCLGRLQQPAPAAWGAAYVAAAAAHLPALAPHQLQLLLAALPALGGAAAFPGLAARLLAQLQPVLRQLTPGQLSSALAATQEAGLQPPEPWLLDCVAAMSTQLPAFTPRHLIRALASLARLRYVPEPAFLAAATEAAVDGLARHRLLPAAFVELLWALTALRVRPSAAWMAKFEARLLERRPERLDGSQLSRLGWCMAALQRRPGQVLMGRWLAATEAAMPSMDGGSLADTLWCCAMLDEQPSRSWLQAFIAASKQQLDALSSSSLVTLMWALALLQQRPPSDWMHRCLGVLASCLDATCAAAATAAAGDAGDTQQQEHQQMAPLSPQQLTRVTWALAALDCQLPAHVSAPLLQLSLAVVDHLDVDSLAQLMWAWDRLDETASKQHVRQLAAAARARLVPEGEQHAHSSSGGALAGLLHGSARMSSTALPVPRQHVPLLRPPAGAQQTAVRLVRGKVVVRPASGRSPAGTATQQQQQQPVVAAARMQELAAAAAAHGVAPSGGRQALLAGLRQLQQAQGEDC